MPRLKTSFVFAPLLVGILISSAWGLSLDSVLLKLDQNYYYPQKQGLKSLSVRVQWEQLDVVSGSGKFLRNPDFNFIWKGGSQLGRFELAEGQEHFSEDRVQELSLHISPFSEPIIPLTLQQKFSSFAGKVHATKKNKFVVGLTQVSSDQEYKLLVDAKEWVVRKLRFKQSRSPQNIEGEFSYLKLEGKPAISETRTRFEVDEGEYLEVTRYTYRKSKGIWWVHRIDQTLKQDDHVLQRYVIKLSDFKPVLSPGL
jgi:hypothetical protein|tara:strand:+ start:303 stop:1067 length:765 start_codon:yes stop_codon:yes gene_type:complete